MLRPLKGILPNPEHAQEIVSPPYDVLTRAQAKELARELPNGFVHISRAEVGFSDDTPFNHPSVYEKAKDIYINALRDGLLAQDEKDCYYVYQIQTNHHTQTGLVTLVPASFYDTGRLKKHELIRPPKAEDRLKHIETLKAQTGPILTTYRFVDELDNLIKQTVGDKPYVDVTWPGRDEHHRIWRVAEQDQIKAFQSALDVLDTIYIADGHHRSYAGVEAAKKEQGDNACLMTVMFPDNELKILPYHRIIKMTDWSDDRFSSKMRQYAQEVPFNGKVPETSNMVISYTKKSGWQQWSLGEVHQNKLPAQVLSEVVLDPVFGITDLRNDDRIDFIGGNVGLEGLKEAVDSGRGQCALGIAATTTADMMRIADDNGIMPPKSTWFEPKLLDGLVSYSLV